ncbi:hypothetical protein ABTF40_18655, partial [Acinetobacter baumannii]
AGDGCRLPARGPQLYWTDPVGDLEAGRRCRGRERGGAASHEHAAHGDGAADRAGAGRAAACQRI